MSENQPTDLNKAFGKIIAQAWTDEAFKKQLLADPAAVLKQHGIELPAGKKLRVHADDATTVNVVLPEAPSDLSDEDLENVAGGVAGACPCIFNRPPHATSRLTDWK